jgi:predicted AAA+ superfamily ATPase
MIFNRLLELSNKKTSAFIFGPRLTGKTTLLRKIKVNHYFDLLDPELELNYRRQPALFWEQLAAVGEKGIIVVDEIQKVPELLNYIQMGIDRFQQTFFLSGSSARKLKRGGANLLGGRALDLKLYPLTHNEIGDRFSLQNALHFGTLPKVAENVFEGTTALILGHLRSYVTTYIKEEIQAEALTRNIGSFQRFLAIAAQSNAQTIEFANVARESSVPASTVKEYYQILEDTLLGRFLWPYDRNERKKARPKFYFFDCGVVRAIQNRLVDPPTPDERGFLYETWFVNELLRLDEYYNKSHDFSFWRDNKNEMDILVSRGGKTVLAIECKSGKVDPASESLLAARKKFPQTRVVVASLSDTMARKTKEDIEILPWKDVVDLYIKEY